MPTRFRKVRKLRGSRTHGWGQIGQHRKHGAKGGRGMAGGHKHKWTWIIKYAPDHFGEKGFVPPTRKEKVVVTIRQLNTIAERLLSSGEAKTDGEYVVVDLSRLGIDKVIGGGEVSKKMKIVVREWSAGAERRLSELGCQLVKPDVMMADVGGR